MRPRRARDRTCPAHPISVGEVDATEMMQGLWQGGLGERAGCTLDFSDLDMVVVLCPTDQDEGRRVKVARPYPVIEIPLTDSRRDMAYIDELHGLSKKVADVVANEGRCGVFCWQGRNRSGLLTALVLRRLQGWSGRQAMEHIRSYRPEALDTASGVFEEYLAGLPAYRPRT